MRNLQSSTIDQDTRVLYMENSYINSEGKVMVRQLLELEPIYYEHIIPLDFILGNKPIVDCEELWDLFEEFEDEIIVETF